MKIAESIFCIRKIFGYSSRIEQNMTKKDKFRATKLDDFVAKMLEHLKLDELNNGSMNKGGVAAEIQDLATSTLHHNLIKLRLGRIANINWAMEVSNERRIGNGCRYIKMYNFEFSQETLKLLVEWPGR